MTTWEIERKSRNVHLINCDAASASWSQWVLLTSDRHLDSEHSDRDMQLRHLRDARERDAVVLDFGDVFDAMQGRNDPRRQKGSGGPSARVAAYLDEIVRDASEFLAPFADRFGVIGRGNHEQSILKNCETDLTERLTERMSMISGSKVHPGGYGGFVRFVPRWSSKGSKRLTLYYFHGSGGGGVMTHGTLATRRMASWVPDAEVVVSGHTHDQWVLTLARTRLGATGNVYLDEQHHVKTPSYKDEFEDGFAGWHVERGAPPKPIGAWWMRLYWKRPHAEIGVEFTRAT